MNRTIGRTHYLLSLQQAIENSFDQIPMEEDISSALKKKVTSLATAQSLMVQHYSQ